MSTDLHTNAQSVVKLVVWDLDDTMWDGVLLEGAGNVMKPGVRDAVLRLDGLGVLQSIASRNEPDAALSRLREFGLEEYFLAPEIGWFPKSAAIARIAKRLDISPSAILFVDDQIFELEEVKSVLPDVRGLQAGCAAEILDYPGIRGTAPSNDGRRRRALYLAEHNRRVAEDEHTGPSDEFLASLNLIISFRDAMPEDITRVNELLSRTNQLNSTGITYTLEDIDSFISGKNKLLIVFDLRDRFGDYGTVGAAAIAFEDHIWTLQVLAVSCRVLSRGIGPFVLTWLTQEARSRGVSLSVSFRDTGRNRPMRVALMLAGMKATSSQDGLTIFEQSSMVELTPARHIRVDSAALSKLAED